MILWRAVYKRDKMDRCITYPAVDDAAAQAFAAEWIRRAKETWRDAELVQVVPWRVGVDVRREDLQARQRILQLGGG